MPRGGISRQASAGYDAAMRKPSLSLDTFVTALAVLGATASAGCSKTTPASNASPEPPAAAAPLAAPQATATAPAPQAAEPAAAATAADESERKSPAPPAAPAAAPKVGAASPVGATAVDGGKPRGVGDGLKKGDKGSMSCGAGGCSPDMKKGNGN